MNCPDYSSDAGGGGEDSTIRKILIFQNERGLHARAAARIVSLVGSFQADVTFVKDDTEVSGDSILGLLMLAAAKGSSIELRAKGPDAEVVIAALVDLIEDRNLDEN